ncbi:hypothetical protein [Bradyrhizobium retamae]|uniref:Uncharacterized protein n=1 Tax=Bradyrhizobium retamae TaxID=1300035 RepID=A0A0R3MW10_9BRAD|nr:hypothetical protein [Bradyrhizobium retamae]KRR21907.1 hypothetical protein CQ13_07680 [Bradyrhizobium retamae]
MTTNTPGSTARQYAAQLVHYARIAVNHGDKGIAAGVLKQWLPKGAVVIGTDVQIVEAFNAGTTNVLTVGLAGVANNLVAAGDADEAAVALTQNVKPTGTALGPLSADHRVSVHYTHTGTAPTTGKAIIIIKYVPDNDL